MHMEEVVWCVLKPRLQHFVVCFFQMAMVTNRLWLSVLVLLFTLSSSVTSRSLRMKREIGLDTNTSDVHGTLNVTEAQDVKATTVRPSYATHATENMSGNISRMNVDDRPASDVNHTREHKVNTTSEKSSNTAGTESVTVHPPKGNETTLYTQAPAKNGSTGRVTQTGSSAPALPASPQPGKVTETHTTSLASGAKTTTPKQTTTTAKALPCPTASLNRDGLVSRCLIAIASMAALTTIFIISTICLATKLSTSRYKHKARLLQETEMVCISALMNDTDHPVPKPRHPKSNGALIPSAEDGDVDGDNLTLNSFLPDSEGPL